MKNFARILATVIVAFGLIAGSLGVAGAGKLPEPETGINTSGGDGAPGGNSSTGGGNNTGSSNQNSDQDQNQDADQGQDVGQGNTNTAVQGNALSGAAGGSVDTSCSANQPDGSLDDDDVDEEEDDEAGDTGDVTNGDDSASCAVGDSTVGNSATGNSNQANSGSQSATNDNSQSLDQNGGNQANAPVSDIDQTTGNSSTAGSGGAGGSAENSGDISVSIQLTEILVRILGSILSGEDTIIVVPGEDDEPGPLVLGPEDFLDDTFVATCSLLDPDPEDTVGITAEEVEASIAAGELVLEDGVTPRFIEDRCTLF